MLQNSIFSKYILMISKIKRLIIGSKTSLLLIAGCFLPLTLVGQETSSSPSSIVGQIFQRMETPPQPRRISADLPIIADIVLIADRDTIETRSTPQGDFSFSGICSKQVSLFINHSTREGAMTNYFSGTFELMPGENVVIVTMPDPKLPPSVPIVTVEGDAWHYHVADGTARKQDFAVEMLTKMPGVEYNKKENVISIPGGAIHRAYVDGAYIFALDPSASL